MAEAEATEAFHLEVDGWDLEESDAAPESGPAKRRKLSLSLKQKDSGSTERFVFLDNAKVEALNKRYVPLSGARVLWLQREREFTSFGRTALRCCIAFYKFCSLGA